MSMMHCERCDSYIDTDFDAEHFEICVDDIEFLNDVENNYIGTAPINKPLVRWIYEPDPDPNYYKRRKAAKKLGMDENELEDEPDNSPESPEQAWA